MSRLDKLNYKLPKNYKEALEFLFFEDFEELEFLDKKIKQHFDTINVSLSMFLDVDYNKLREKILDAAERFRIIDIYGFVATVSDFIPDWLIEKKDKSLLPKKLQNAIKRLEEVINDDQ